jgi:assimilatory nitrate reductase catalytic subunit
MDIPVHIHETRQQQLIRTGKATPRFLQGVYPFAGRGVFDPVPVHDELRYIVPKDRLAEVIYFRAGNLSDDILYLSVTANDTPVRYFPIGPKSDIHVPLAIVESYPAGTKIEIIMAAPRGLSGTIVVDAGLLEIEAGA